MLLGMYTIVARVDGTFLCIGKAQDGHETWVESSLEAAIRSMKRFGKTMNGWKKVRRKDITHLREEPVKLVEWNPQR